jgi:hypothetical protein
MLDIAFDEKLGILRCVSDGYTPVGEVEAFGRKAVMLQTLARTRRGRCLILVDAANTATQTQESMGHLSQLAATRREAKDRTAIIIGSALAKLQAQRATPKDTTGYFATEEDALAWLLADG